MKDKKKKPIIFISIVLLLSFSINIAYTEIRTLFLDVSDVYQNNVLNEPSGVEIKLVETEPFELANDEFIRKGEKLKYSITNSNDTAIPLSEISIQANNVEEIETDYIEFRYREEDGIVLSVHNFGNKDLDNLYIRLDDSENVLKKWFPDIDTEISIDIASGESKDIIKIPCQLTNYSNYSEIEGETELYIYYEKNDFKDYYTNPSSPSIYRLSKKYDGTFSFGYVGGGSAARETFFKVLIDSDTPHKRKMLSDQIPANSTEYYTIYVYSLESYKCDIYIDFIFADKSIRNSIEDIAFSIPKYDFVDYPYYSWDNNINDDIVEYNSLSDYNSNSTESIEDAAE